VENGTAYNLGLPSAPVWVNNAVKLTYTGGDDCNGKPRTTDIIFKCNDDVETAQPLVKAIRRARQQGTCCGSLWCALRLR
jgi:hypothetical protein